MYIERNYVIVSEIIYTRCDSDEDKLNKFKKAVRYYIDIIKKFITSDLTKLSDKEFYELLNEFYGICLGSEDYLKMLSKYYNKQYTSINKIPTTMTYTSIATEKFAKKFDWWEQLYQVYYFAATSEQVMFDYNKVYSKKEIKKLVSDKDIIILKEETEPIGNQKKFTRQKYELIPSLDFNMDECYSSSYTIPEFFLDNSNLIGELLRKEVTKRTILKDMRNTVFDLTHEISDILLSTKSKDSLYFEVASMCIEWFKSSEEKNELQKIIKKIIPEKDLIYFNNTIIEPLENKEKEQNNVKKLILTKNNEN